MIKEFKFEVGQTYKNRKGKYTVVAIDGDVMHISWKGGQEVATSVKLQSRVLENIRREIEESGIVKAVSSRKKTAVAVSI